MIRLSHIMKKYDAITPIKDIDEEIKSGEVISIIGPSGTGKSTLLRMINGLEKPTSGKIFVDGIEVNDKNSSEITKKVGMVFQNYYLFNHLTVIENLMIAQVEILKRDKQVAYDRSIELLKQVRLNDKENSYPSELSGGEKQRIALARTLAMDPDVLLLDEPTAALDPKLVDEIKDLILKYAKSGKTVLMVAHSMQLARDVSTRVFYLDEGVIYEEGTPDQIFDNPRKEKTQSFIKNQNAIEFKIDKKFNFTKESINLAEFCLKHNAYLKVVNKTLLEFEEVTMQILLDKYDNPGIKVRVVYKNQIVTMHVKYKGEKFNIKDSNNDISFKLVEGLATSIDYSFNEKDEYVNTLLIKIK